MIFPVAGILIGAFLGAWQARRRGGAAQDMAQWATVFALILGLVGLFVLIGFQRSAL